jgi:hypothetical protein
MNTDNNTIGRVKTLISIIRQGSHAGTEKQPHSPPEDQLHDLNFRMSTMVKKMHWSTILTNIEDVPLVLAPALVHASNLLHSTDLKDRIITTHSVRNQEALDNELSSEEKEEWFTLLKGALKQTDWEALFTHRLSYLLLFPFFNANSLPSSDLTSGAIAICASPSSAKIVECRGST